MNETWLIERENLLVGGGGCGCDPPPPPNKVFQRFEKAIYSKRLRLSVAVQTSSAEILKSQLCVHNNRKFQVGLPKNQLNSVFFPVFFIKLQKFAKCFTFHKHSGLILYEIPLFFDLLKKYRNLR